MVYFPPIPTKPSFTGDKAAAKAHYGFGRKRFSDLITFMKPRGLKVASNTITLDDGTTVKTEMNHGRSKIIIHSPPSGGGKKTKKIYTPCYCECGISVGKVMTGYADGLDDPELYIPFTGADHDAEFCQEWEPPKHTMEEVEDVSPTDFFPHRGPEPEEVNEEMVDSRLPDKVYGLVQTGVSGIDGIPSQSSFENIGACNWLNFSILSIQPKPSHKPSALAFLEVLDE